MCSLKRPITTDENGSAKKPKIISSTPAGKVLSTQKAKQVLQSMQLNSPVTPRNSAMCIDKSSQVKANTTEKTPVALKCPDKQRSVSIALFTNEQIVTATSASTGKKKSNASSNASSNATAFSNPNPVCKATPSSSSSNNNHVSKAKFSTSNNLVSKATSASSNNLVSKATSASSNNLVSKATSASSNNPNSKATSSSSSNTSGSKANATSYNNTGSKAPTSSNLNPVSKTTPSSSSSKNPVNKATSASSNNPVSKTKSSSMSDNNPGSRVTLSNASNYTKQLELFTAAINERDETHAKDQQLISELRIENERLSKIHSFVDQATWLEISTLYIKQYGSAAHYLKLQHAKDKVAVGIISLRYPSITVDANFKNTVDEFWCKPKTSNNAVFRMAIKQIIPDKSTWMSMKKEEMFATYKDEIAAVHGNNNL
jgi:hypothetical protein